MFANVETSYLLFSTYTDTSKEGPNNRPKNKRCNDSDD